MTKAGRDVLKVISGICNTIFRANRDIELAPEIDSIDAVETRPVEVQEAHCLFNRASWTRLPNAIVKRVVVLALKVRQSLLDCPCMPLEALVRVDKFTVGIGENGTLRLEVEEHSTSTQEWFQISTILRWEQRGILMHKPSFAPGPLQKRLKHLRPLDWAILRVLDSLVPP